jgi:lipid II:glycine glycyltransferase (peptidoglycan interpeptide bridge formation enzyme)
MQENLKITQVNDWQEWERLLLSSKEYSFLQAWQFGDLHNSMGNKVERLVLGYDSKPVIMAQLIIIKAKRGKVMQSRHAPIFLPAYEELPQEEQLLVVNEFLGKIREIAKAQRCDFIRLQALVKLDCDHVLLKLIQAAGYKRANIHNIDAEKTLLLDITKPEQELLQNMRKQTRYYVRKAEKLGVSVSEYDDMQALDTFYKIHHDTTIRQQFRSYSHKYYRDSFHYTNSIEGSKLKAKIFLAQYQGKQIAAAIIVFFGKKAFYSDGGSLSEFSKIPASYLIQWQAIKAAKTLGCETYNFWGGVSPEKEDKNYPWYGIDLFKRGFGGERQDYMHAHDLGLSWKYNFTRLWERYERIKRGY